MQNEYSPSDILNLNKAWRRVWQCTLVACVIAAVAFAVQSLLSFLAIDTTHFNTYFLGGIAVIILTAAFLILACIWGYILLYRCWKCLPQGWARTTPGRAVGFLFIPVFTYYWSFVAYVGYATDVNRVLERCGKPQAKMARGLAIFYCIWLIVYSIPLPSNEVFYAWTWTLVFFAEIAVSMGLFFVILWQMRRAAVAVVQFFIDHPQGLAADESPAPLPECRG